MSTLVTDLIGKKVDVKDFEDQWKRGVVTSVWIDSSNHLLMVAVLIPGGGILNSYASDCRVSCCYREGSGPECELGLDHPPPHMMKLV